MAASASLMRYINSLPGLLSGVTPDITMYDPRDFVDALSRLVSSTRFHPYIRRGRIKSTVEALRTCGYIEKYKLRFSWFMKERAYMRDSGYVSFSLHYVSLSEGSRLCKIVLHEISHLRLLESDGYCELLSLDREFLSEYGADKRVRMLSPVELYATLFSVVLMELAEAEIGALRAEIEEERRKLHEAYETFKKINN